MKKIVIFLSGLFFLYGIACKQSTPPEKISVLYVGNFTNSADTGIYVYHFDRSSLAVTLIQNVSGMVSPSFFCLAPDKNFLFAVNRNSVNDSTRWGSVSSYKIDKQNGRLTVINHQPSYGSDPCHISVDRKGRAVFISNYGSGSMAKIIVNADGSLSDQHQVFQHEGSSVNPQRQNKPHVHSTIVSRDNRFVYAADLGTDKINIYRYDESQQELFVNEVPYASCLPGAGPRHMEFHPTLNIFYVIEELTSRVEVFEWTQSGALNPIQDISSLPDGWTGVNYCADIHADPSGKFLYTSNRGHNSVTAFTIEEITGKIRMVTQTSTQGEWPRNFLLDPIGEFIFVANQNTDNVSIFRWDTSSGHTVYSGNQWKVPSPVCLQLLEL